MIESFNAGGREILKYLVGKIGGNSYLDFIYIIFKRACSLMVDELVSFLGLAKARNIWLG